MDCICGIINNSYINRIMVMLAFMILWCYWQELLAFIESLLFARHCAYTWLNSWDPQTTPLLRCSYQPFRLMRIQRGLKLSPWGWQMLLLEFKPWEASVGTESACSCRRCRRQGFSPWVGKTPWRRAQQPAPVFLPGESLTEEPGGLQSVGSKSRTRLSN